MGFTRPKGLNHVAYITWDTEATTKFYTEVMGMRLVGHALGDQVGSTGERSKFLHTFFQMADGSCIAFFEVEGVPREGPSVIPSWVRHIALSVGSMDELLEAKKKLESHGIEVRGVVDHEGIWNSIYFFDPNGVRLELTWQSEQLTDEHAREAERAVAAWNRERKAAATP
jgi:glyoxylase I family protein